MTRVAEAVATTLGIVDDRVAMSADVDADIYLDRPDARPLSSGETHATLRISGEDASVAIELDHDDLEAVADALADARTWEDDP